MTDEIVPLITGPSPELDIEEVIRLYPRQEGMHLLRTMWQSDAIPIDPQTKRPVTLTQLAEGFRAYAKSVAKEGTERKFIRKIGKYMAEFGWLDTYDLPKAPVQSPKEAREAIVERMKSAAAKGNRFSQDWLKRNA